MIETFCYIFFLSIVSFWQNFGVVGFSVGRLIKSQTYWLYIVEDISKKKYRENDPFFSYFFSSDIVVVAAVFASPKVSCDFR